MKINDADGTINTGKLYDFLRELDSDYMPTLSERGMNLQEYAEKLASLSTLCYEEDNDELIAIVAGYTHDIKDSTSFITIVGCRNSHRREGLTRILLKSYIAICREHEITAVRTTTHPQNIKAQKFYESCGFKRYDGSVRWGEPEKVHYRYILK